MSSLTRKAPSAPVVLTTGVLVYVICFALSLALHGAVVGPYVAWVWVNLELDSPGEDNDNDGPVGNNGGELAAASPTLAPPVPVNVSIYVEPVRSSSKATPTASTKPSSKPDRSTGSESSTEPEAERQGEKTEGTGTAKKLGVAGKPPRGKKKPCEPIDEVTKISTYKWAVERDLIDWYATHLRQLEKEAGVATHKDKDGKPDGARLYLPRCSVLKQGGFRNGDIIRSVNGRKVYTIPQAVAAYLAVRKDGMITVKLTRKNGNELTHRYRLK